MVEPAVGSDVHYVTHGTPGGEFPSVCASARVTEAPSGTASSAVGLCVFYPNGLSFKQDVTFGEHKDAGTWHWPENEYGRGQVRYVD